MPFLTIRNSLAYPAGAAVGFNSTHPASINPIFSGVALGGNFVRLFPFNSGTIAGSPIAALDSTIGPSLKFSAAGDVSSFLNTIPITYSPTETTYGAIINLSAFTNAGCILGSAYSGAGGTRIDVASSTGVLRFVTTALAVYSSGIALTANQPYFVACTAKFSSICYFLVKNLLTGAVQTSSITIGNLTPPTASTIYVGDNGTSHNPTGLIAAAMTSYTYIGAAGLLAWSKDPWSYWYPNTIGDPRTNIGSVGTAAADTLYPQIWC